MSTEIQKNGYLNTREDLHDPEDEVWEDGFSGADIYHNEIKGIKLLTREDEVALSEKIQAGQEALNILSQKATDSFSQEEIDELNRTIKEGGKARERFIVSNLKLARAVANKSNRGRGLDLDDLVQEANIGLIKAVEKFDGKRGYRFSTYAYWWISQGIGRALANQGNLVRIPVYLNNLRIKIWELTNNFFKLYGKNPTDEELVLISGIDPELLEKAKKSYIQMRYLSERVGDDEDGEELGELLPSNLLDPGREAEEGLDHKRTRQAVQQAFSSLSPQQRAVVTLRFGLDRESGDGHRTLEEVGEEIGKTRERVRQIEANAISRLRLNRGLRAIARDQVF